MILETLERREETMASGSSGSLAPVSGDADAAVPSGIAAPLVRIALVTAMIFCTMALIPPTADALVREQFSRGNESVSLFFIVHSLPQVLLLGILAGIFSDRIRRRVPLAIGGAVLTGITTVLHPQMPSFASLLVLRFFDGIFGIVALGMLMTRAVDLSTPETRPRVMAFYLASIPVGYLTGSFFVAYMGDGRLATVYTLGGVLLVFAGLLLLFDLRGAERIGAVQPDIRSIVGVLRTTPRLWLPIFFGFVDKFTFALLALLTGLVMSDQFRLSAVVWGGSALGALWLAYLVAAAPAGWLCRRLGAWRAVAFGSAGYGVVLTVVLHFNDPLAFTALIGLAGVFIAIQMVPVMVLVGDLAGPQSRATAMSCYNLVGSFGMMAGFGFAGTMSGALGYRAVFISGGVLELLCVVIALYAGGRFVAGSRRFAGDAPRGTNPSV